MTTNTTATPTGKKMTKAQERAAREAERVTSEITRFRREHERVRAARKWTTTHAAMDSALVAREAAREDRAQLDMLAFNAGWRYEQARDRYKSGLESYQRSVERAIADFNVGALPGSFSRVDSTDLQTRATEYEAAARTFAEVAVAAGWRVPALEGPEMAAIVDERVRYGVMPPVSSFDTWKVVRLDDEGLPVRVTAQAWRDACLKTGGGRYEPGVVGDVANESESAVFATEDAAWQAVGALCGHWLY